MTPSAKSSPMREAGKLRVFVIQEYSLLPNVPTMTELGFKQDLLSAWFAWIAPAGIPEEAKKVLIPAVEKSIKDPELRSKIENRGYIVDYKSPAELKKIIASDYETARVWPPRWD